MEMIKNEDIINKYKEYNKIYIPENYNNEEYTYKMNGDYITIITNKQCYTQYSTTYCTCYYYNWKENVISESYTCSTNNNNPTIAKENITKDINYSDRILQSYTNNQIIYMGIFIIGIILAILMTKRGAYR